jgi:hypothetical protein
MNNKQKVSIKFHVNKLRKELSATQPSPTGVELVNKTEGVYQKPSKGKKKKVQTRSAIVTTPGLK